jgi:hypothetical protein
LFEFAFQLRCRRDPFRGYLGLEGFKPFSQRDRISARLGPTLGRFGNATGKCCINER